MVSREGRKTAAQRAMDTMRVLDQTQTPREPPPPRGSQTEDVPQDWAHLEPER